MHNSPTCGHPESLPDVFPIRPASRRFRPVFQRLLQIVLAVGCLLQLIGIAAFAQDSQSSRDTITQGQAVDQPTSPTTSTEVSDEVIKDVLSEFQRGFEAHNLDKVLGVFDPDSMQGYAQFRDQMAAYFRLHESFKMRYELLQVNADKDLGTATADIEMDEDPLDTLPTPQRRSTQMRFQIKRTPKGWRIVGLRPMEFFGA
jgi:hypothetical protein